MAELTIRLVVDVTTGKKDVVIGYESDAGSLPIEHEEEHRKLVDQLIKGGLLNAQEVGKVVVERVGGQSSGEAPTEAEAQDVRQKQKT
jgi:polyhydroxyalkanoate synthesis regulator phasin